ncbi:hypothetical protein PI124_g4302 [Phytophthora idaei]|nr:hypothetical protein PI126_g7367 [Phytophthora idaei]KAG3251049.1 hypothetical protein PI124_g4302 [Phytophthora idaei]
MHPSIRLVDIQSSVFCCLRHSLASAVADDVNVLTSYMQELDDLNGLFDDDYITSIQNGENGGSKLGLFVAARLHCCNIQVQMLNDDCAYTVANASQTICIARIGPYFAL